MENHPIPQDVTGFKFKLIGSVTVKQFLYLLGFGILTTIAFVLNVNLLIKIPMMMLFASIGLALAFLPIEGRPMDTMLVNFAKAIPSENRYIYRKRGVNLASFEFLKVSVKNHVANQSDQLGSHTKSAHDEKKSILLSKLRNSSFRPDDEEVSFFKNIKAAFENDSKPFPKISNVLPQNLTVANPIMPKPEPKIIKADEINTSKEPLKKPENPIEEIKKQLEEAKEMQEKNLGNREDLGLKIKELENELQKSLLEKEALAQKIVEIEVGQDKRDEKIFAPSQGNERKETQNVKFVATSSTLQAGFPSLPDVPNIVMGIVRDSRGKTLPNILVEFVEENNIPVRTFKTNALGQFAAATPLTNGTYKIYFEDPQKIHEFEIIEITLNGEIFNPIEVKSVDSRERLRRELFGAQTAASSA